MITRDINISKYGWQARIFFAISRYEIDDVTKALEEIGCPGKIYAQAVKQMERGEVNTGFTYSNKALRRSVMLVGRTSSGAQFVNSFSHELRHLSDDIASTYGMEMAGEEVAYLTGDIAQKLSDVVSHLSCEHCRKGDGEFS